MSRGLGRTQRSVLEVLPPSDMGEWVSVTTLTAEAGDVTLTPANVRRAVRTLAARGLVVTMHHEDNRPGRRGDWRQVLQVRRPMSAVEEDAWRRSVLAKLEEPAP